MTDAEALHGERVVLRPLSAGDVPALLAIHATPEVAQWWGNPDEGFPLSDEPEATRYAIVESGSVIGMVQYGEEPDAGYRHAWIDLFIDPARHGRGIGGEVVALMADHLIGARGHHRITIDPAADNPAAIRAYEKAGFQRVGVMRRRWYDKLQRRWRDTLFMERIDEGAATAPADQAADRLES